MPVEISLQTNCGEQFSVHRNLFLLQPHINTGPAGIFRSHSCNKSYKRCRATIRAPNALNKESCFQQCHEKAEPLTLNSHHKDI